MTTTTRTTATSDRQHRCPGGDNGRRTYLRHSWVETGRWTTGGPCPIRVRVFDCRRCNAAKTVETPVDLDGRFGVRGAG